MMKTQVSQQLSNWRQLAVCLLLLCATSFVPGAHAEKAGAAITDSAALNFVDAEVQSVIRAVGQYARVNFVIDPRVKGNITLESEKALTRAQAFSLLASALRMQGYAVVMGDGYAKVVPERDAKLEAGLPKTKSIINGNQIVTQIFRLNYESAANMVAVLKPLISANNAINANPGNNTLVITDYLDNLRRLGKIIAALDAPSASELEIVPIRHAVASDIAIMSNKLLSAGNANSKQGIDAGIVILADSRQNAVVIRAPSPARVNLAKSLIAKLDQPTAFPGNVHVVYLKNADANELAKTLQSVFSPSATASRQTAVAESGTAADQAHSENQSSESTQTNSVRRSGFIQADPSTNTLIITADDATYRNLRSVIDQLDVRRAQIYIESLIAEVSDEKAAEFGVQWAGLSGDDNSKYRVGGASTFGSGGDNLYNLATAAGTIAPSNGIKLGVFRQIGGELTLGALVSAIKDDANSNILSTPNLITLDNKEAKIIVGKNVPFITGQYTTTASSSSASVNPFQTIERQDVGLTLKVKPQVSEGGTVRMAIYQEISSVDSTTNDAGIITKKRSIETNVLAKDGQIVVLGGLIENSVEDGIEKVPLLGDVPLLGNLFKYETRSRKKTNLMVFLRPIVIRDNEQSISLVADRYDYIRNAQARTMPEGSRPLLPALQDGKPIGGMLANPVFTEKMGQTARPQGSQAGTGDKQEAK